MYMGFSAIPVGFFLSIMWTLLSTLLSVGSMPFGGGLVGKAVTEVKTTRERARMALESCILMEFNVK